MPWFYGAYTVSLAAAGLVVVSGANLVALSVSVQLMNALLLPIVLGFLYLLAQDLPARYRLRGGYAIAVALTIGATAGVAVYRALADLR